MKKMVPGAHAAASVIELGTRMRDSWCLHAKNAAATHCHLNAAELEWPGLTQLR